MSVTTLVDDIQAKRAESERLLDMLKYYEWLEEHGLSWDQIKGIRPNQGVGPYGRVAFKDWQQVPKSIRDRYEYKKVKKLIDIRLPDGTTTMLPWPPFHDDVIYNRSRL